jgi:diadenosine tetraphosphate (Ap4A) HIT family hydrolase
MSYETLEEAKTFGVAPWNDEVRELEDFHFMVFRDKYPVTNGHLLFVPKFNNNNIIAECFEFALAHGQKMVANGECDGFNIGLNVGLSAGQTVMYPHVHLIPRRNGDMEDPRGGVRHVIPEKGNYKKGEKNG